MTEQESQPDPEESLSAPDQDELVEGAVEQAYNFHTMISRAKTWARDTVVDLRVEAALEEDAETAAEIEEASRLVESVIVRIEQGDNTRARAPKK